MAEERQRLLRIKRVWAVCETDAEAETIKLKPEEVSVVAPLIQFLLSERTLAEMGSGEPYRE